MRQLKITKQVTNRETASLDKYLQEIGKVDLISADEEVILAQKIKEKYPRKPMILLAFDESEVKSISSKADTFFDNIFIWTGNSHVFAAIIKYVEDRKNAEQDIVKGDVRAIILIEDSPRMYSILLPMIYREIIYLTKNLMSKTLNSTYRSLHLRGRLKVLLTPNYETAVHFSEKYGDNIIGIISDVKFLNKGIKDSHAGMKFAKTIRDTNKIRWDAGFLRGGAG